jgi:hypothetical protein
VILLNKSSQDGGGGGKITEKSVIDSSYFFPSLEVFFTSSFTKNPYEVKNILF